jgi:hypothetical protein
VFIQLWTLLSKTWAPNKCHFFLWFVAHNRCWTAYRLARRNLPHPDRCLFCDQDERLFTIYWPPACLRDNSGHPYCSKLDSQVSLLSPPESTFDDWWRRVLSSVHITLQGGLSSLFILGAWTLWRHPNDCVFNGVSPRVSVALSMAREEAWAWCMARANGISLLTTTDLATGS